jgi:hypothetical protein
MNQRRRRRILLMMRRSELEAGYFVMAGLVGFSLPVKPRVHQSWLYCRCSKQVDSNVRHLLYVHVVYPLRKMVRRYYVPGINGNQGVSDTRCIGCRFPLLELLPILLMMVHQCAR